MRRSFILFAVFFGVGILQLAPWFSIGGIRPNVILAAAVAWSLFARDMLRLSAVLVVGVLILRAGGSDLGELLIFLGLIFAVFLARARIPGKPFVNTMLFITVITFLFYALFDWGFLQGSFGAVLQETVYNVVVGAICFTVLSRFATDRYETDLRASF